MSSNRSVFPLAPSPEITDAEPKTIDLFTEQGSQVLDVLGADTARSIVAELSEDPATKSDLAGQFDTSLQNVHYHVNRLEDAGIVRVVGTHYSARGVEMDVYALDGAPIVLVGGDDHNNITDHLSEEASIT